LSKYRVVLAYGTSLEFEIEAKNKEEAKKKAEILGDKTLIDRDLICRMKDGDVIEKLE